MESIADMEAKLIYENPLSCRQDIEGFVAEGSVNVCFENGKMRMKNGMSPELGQKANFVLWCPEEFPADVMIEWDFRPIEEPGLCILFFAAKGRGGEDIFDASLAERNGEYDRYHSGDINAYHVSYFRRKWEDERAFHTCNLRKSHGFHLVCQGADPIPDARDAKESYRLCVKKYRGKIEFSIDGLTSFSWEDDASLGAVLGGGKIGFRQMAPLVGEYSRLKVYELF